MPPWFWGWLATTVAFAFAALWRDRSAAAFCVGAAAATLLSGFRASITVQWIAFLLLAFPLLVLSVRRRYRKRHGRGAASGPD